MRTAQPFSLREAAPSVFSFWGETRVRGVGGLVGFGNLEGFPRHLRPPSCQQRLADELADLGWRHAGSPQSMSRMPSAEPHEKECAGVLGALNRETQSPAQIVRIGIARPDPPNKTLSVHCQSPRSGSGQGHFSHPSEVETGRRRRLPERHVRPCDRSPRGKRPPANFAQTKQTERVRGWTDENSIRLGVDGGDSLEGGFTFRRSA